MVKGWGEDGVLKGGNNGSEWEFEDGVLKGGNNGSEW